MKFYYLGGVVDTIYIQLKMKLWIKKPINVYWKIFMFKRLEQLMFAQLILFLRNNNIVIFQSYKLSPSHIYDCNNKLLSLSLSLSLILGVTSFSIDVETKRVTVMGHVSPVGVLESISKVKKAEFWPCWMMSTSNILEAKANLKNIKSLSFSLHLVICLIIYRKKKVICLIWWSWLDRKWERVQKFDHVNFLCIVHSTWHKSVSIYFLGINFSSYSCF